MRFILIIMFLVSFGSFSLSTDSDVYFCSDGQNATVSLDKVHNESNSNVELWV